MVNKPADPELITGAAKQAIAQAGVKGDPIACLMAIAFGDKRLREALLYRAAKVAIDDAKLMRPDIVRSLNATRKERSAPKYNVTNAAATARLLSIKFTIFDMELWGGKKRLGDATKADLLESADRYRKSARADTSMMRFNERIAAALPNNNSKVADVLSEDRARAIYDGAGLQPLRIAA